MKTFKSFLVLVAVLMTTTQIMATSCSVNSRSGNGNVVKDVRAIESFSEITASTGVNVYLFQSDEEKVVVEADENLMDLIKTEVKGNTLKCYIDGSIRRSKKLNIYVSFKALNSIKASSGADISSETLIKGGDLTVHSSSGADIKLQVEVNSLKSNSSSGADIKLVGTCDSFDGDASSGADINAEKLIARSANTSASSAGDIRIHVTEFISANASSGGDITYMGTPAQRDIHESSGGDVTQK